MDKLNVTLVGAGHYARDLIYPKYKAHPGWNVKATISPHSSIPGVRAFVSVAEWESCYGTAKADDVFDLCLFPYLLPAMVRIVGAIGVEKIILPKPIAEDVDSLSRLCQAIADFGIKAVVASQWCYDIELRRKLYGENKVRFVFSQRFKSKQQDLVNAFLPHAMQLCRYTRGDIKIDFKRGPEKIRKVRINKGRSIDLVKRGDLLKDMVDDFYQHFAHGRSCGLSLHNYLPVAQMYLRYKEVNRL